ncbi:hypothetical protein [Thiohalophilus sp.]|uniref:hypothetical protein n=1 Tax=Thiohalophilus sp. TaxID=3028392 RepID=UPI002ACDAE09|nr:hypothetical protein [Thiohalophilus sp.]MDZ7660947.1 hypothetical protein [Thiohalophilus sp.]
MAALIIPIVALLAANHRSEQTKAQILSNNQQNIFSNYYKHIEEFEKYIETNIDQTEMLIEKKRSCHRRIYPKASKGDFSVDEELAAKVETNSNEIYEFIEYFHKGHRKMSHDTIVDIELNLREIERNLSMRWSPKNVNTVTLNNVTVRAQKNSLKHYFRNIKNRSHAILDVLEFDQYFEVPKSLRFIARGNYSEVPDVEIKENGSYPAFEFIKDYKG